MAYRRRSPEEQKETAEKIKGLVAAGKTMQQASDACGVSHSWLRQYEKASPSQSAKKKKPVTRHRLIPLLPSTPLPEFNPTQTLKLILGSPHDLATFLKGYHA